MIEYKVLFCVFLMLLGVIFVILVNIFFMVEIIYVIDECEV